MVRIKRVYEPVEKEDGSRYLVERLWPRGVSQSSLHMTAWVKEVAPSPELRKWYQHDVSKWADFRRRYWRELNIHPDACRPLLEASRKGDVTLLFSARDVKHNSALILKSYLERRLKH